MTATDWSFTMSEHSNHGFEFGPHRLDAGERLLWRGDEVVPLTPKTFEMLLVLLESNGHVLTKEELMKRVESADDIEALRKALGAKKVSLWVSAKVRLSLWRQSKGTDKTSTEPSSPELNA